MSFNDIHDAIYGGPLPLPELEAALAAHGLRWPVRVAVDLETADDRSAKWVFRPGDGLIYLTHYGRGRLEGWRMAESPNQWPVAMQDCILELRAKTLRGEADVSPEQADQLRQLAMRQFQDGRADWESAVRVWADATLRRTHRKIHDAQRAFLAFALEAGVPLETIGLVGHRHHHALQGLLGAFTGEALTNWLLEALGIVREQLDRESRQLDPALRRALAFMEAHLAEPISLTDVAKAVAMAPAAFSRKFKAGLGETYTEHLQGLRLERATTLLLRTQRTVLAIALDCGFGSVEQFHRVFKQRLGMTPLAWRRGREVQVERLKVKEPA